MPVASIAAIEYFLPSTVLSNEELESEFPEWPAAKIEAKTGIAVRRIAAPDQCASDLAFQAARQLFASGVVDPASIGYLILCTQSPDYLLPTTACLLQSRLGIPTSAGAIDFNQGCSGFVYGLSLAKGLIESGQSDRVLLLTAETYSKLIHPSDTGTRTIFGDAAAAVLIEAADPAHACSVGDFIFGTDGSGAANLMVRNGGSRHPLRDLAAEPGADKLGNLLSPDWLYMNGPEIFAFTLRTIPRSVAALLEKSGKSATDIDLFVFHQANQYMLEHLRRKLSIPQDRFLVHMAHCGNTVSSTIPIALRHAAVTGRLKPGNTAMLLGFGVGYSWAGGLLHWGGGFRSKA